MKKKEEETFNKTGGVGTKEKYMGGGEKKKHGIELADRKVTQKEVKTKKSEEADRKTRNKGGRYDVLVKRKGGGN